MYITKIVHKINIEELKNEHLNDFEAYMRAVRKASSYVRVQASMGTVFSYFTGKVDSSNIQRDPVEEMAKSRTRDEMSQNDLRRYRSAFQVVREFLDNGASMMKRQAMLEFELETCQER